MIWNPQAAANIKAKAYYTRSAAWTNVTVPVERTKEEVLARWKSDLERSFLGLNDA